MKKTVFTILVLFISYWLPGQSAMFGQGKEKVQVINETFQEEPVRELRIGDKVPDIEFTMINYSSPVAKLSDFRGKLVILDFWATWCGSCISKFNKMDSLQKKFGNDLQILLVNEREKEKKVADFLIKWKGKHTTFDLPSVIDDTISLRLFPHTEIPHYAWIDRHGNLMAITSAEELSMQNIEKVINQEDNVIKLPQKTDFFNNRMMPLGENTTLDDLAQYSIFRKGKLNGLGSFDKTRFINGIFRGRGMRNKPLLEMYEVIIHFLNEAFIYPEKRTILNVKDISGLVFNGLDSEKESWEEKNLYTYDILVPEAEADNVYEYMLNDLNRYSSYHGEIQKRKTKCLLLVRTSKKNKIKTQGAKFEYRLYNTDSVKRLINVPVSRLVWGLNRLKSIQMLVLDETNYSGNIDMQFRADLNDLESIRKALRQYDLDLVEAEREIDMFVLSDDTSKSKEQQK